MGKSVVFFVCNKKICKMYVFMMNKIQLFKVFAIYICVIGSRDLLFSLMLDMENFNPFRQLI